jgi:hypothetical protein
MDLLVSILVSIVGSIVTVLLGIFVRSSRYLRLGSMTLLGNALKHSVAERIDYNNVPSFIDSELDKASDIRIIAGRGRFFDRTAFVNLAETAKKRNKSIRILLPCTKSQRDRVDWVAINEQELMKHNPGYGTRNSLRDQINNTAKTLVQFERKGLLYVRRFNTTHLGRFVITENIALIVPYTGEKRGDSTSAYCYKCESEIYKWFSRIFEVTWQSSIPSRL